jgi:hypothetical protein
MKYALYNYTRRPHAHTQQILLNTDRKKDAGEGERVELSTVVEPDADRNKGSVERWLVEMEQSMRDTLKEIARKVR